jgi:hypothetical protein
MRNGVCIGSDYQATKLFEIILPLGEILNHPSNIPSKTQYVAGPIMHNPLPPLERDRYIAGCMPGFRTDLLIATPAQDVEILRSGTWATVRYARKCGIPRIILLP